MVFRIYRIKTFDCLFADLSMSIGTNATDNDRYKFILYHTIRHTNSNMFKIIGTNQLTENINSNAFF